MFVLSFSLLVLSIREDTADIEVMLDFLKNVIIFYQSFNRGNGKDCCVLTIPCFCLVVLDDVICDHRHSLL